MLLKGRTGKVAPSDVAVNELFLSSLQNAIVEKRSSGKKPSTSYSPSGLACIRAMYYKRRGEIPSADPQTYSDIGMADTGTSRHESIQNALIYMTQHGSRFRYIDVGDYVRKLQENGKALQLKVLGKDGVETLLWDTERDIKFRVDGVILDSRSNEYYLFEFKNQISYNATGKSSTDTKHYLQVYCYCYELCLDKAFVVYENRDTCELYLPEVFEVSDYNKQTVISKIDQCEVLARKGLVPNKPTNVTSTDCRWCNYRKLCRSEG